MSTRHQLIWVCLLAFFMTHCGESVVSVPGDGAAQEQGGVDLGQGDMGQQEPEDMRPDSGAIPVTPTPAEDMGQQTWDMTQDAALDMAQDLGEPVVLPPEDPEEPAPPEPAEEPDPQEPNNPVVKTTEFGGLHWNIAGGKENGCRTEGIKRAVLRYVKTSGRAIDFISLNEVCHAQFVAIRDALRVYWKKGNKENFFAFQASGSSRVGNALFSRRNIHDVTRLEVGQDQWGKRYLLCGRQQGRRVRVCTTHLTPGDATARVQLKKVIKKLEDFWSNKRDTVIIGGDFNIPPNDAGFNGMYSASANTPNNPGNHGRYREWDDNDPANCKGYGERTNPGTTRGPCSSGLKIDFIFTRENRIVNNKYSANTLNIPTDCTGACSDHRAIQGYAKIRFRTD